MSVRPFTLLSLSFLAGLPFTLPAGAADRSDQRLVAVAVQDEPRTIPEDNTAYFTRADRKVRFQLVKLSGAGGGMLAGTNVTVIGPTGQQSKLTADAQGMATLNDATPGLHALVVASEKGHTAVPIALREANGPQAADLAQAAPLSSPVIRLPLMDIDPQEVVRLTSSYLTPDMGAGYDQIDNEFVTSGNVSQGLQYRVRLGDEATLDGQVYSVVRDGLSTYGIAGTNLLIYRDNQLVARTTADNRGKFVVNNMVPGVYGLIAAGPAGYAAFAFEAYDAATVASLGNGQTLVTTGEARLTMTNTMARGSVLPVVLIPPAMVPSVVEQIRMAGFPVGGGDGFVGDPGFVSPVPGIGGAPFGGPGGFAGGGFAGPGGFSGGGGGFGGPVGGAGGGLGGLLGLAALGGIAALAIEAADDDDNDFFIPPDATTTQL